MRWLFCFLGPVAAKWQQSAAIFFHFSPRNHPIAKLTRKPTKKIAIAIEIDFHHSSNQNNATNAAIENRPMTMDSARSAVCRPKNLTNFTRKDFSQLMVNTCAKLIRRTIDVDFLIQIAQAGAV
jgi:hypothetical protein